MNTTMVWLIASTIAVTLSLFSAGCTTQSAMTAERPPLEQTRRLAVEKPIPRAQRTVQEQAALGQRAYRQSCVYCHGIWPQGLPHENPPRFVQAVLRGIGEMPALGFKLDAEEVERMRLYIELCAKDNQVC